MHAGTGFLEPKFHHLLDAVLLFFRRGETGRGLTQLCHFHRLVVGAVGPGQVLGGDPETQTAANLPVGLPRFAHHFVVILHHVVAVRGPVTNHPGADLGGDDQFHLPGGNAGVLGPSAIFNRVQHDNSLVR